jgi:hypothetical protein
MEYDLREIVKEFVAFVVNKHGIKNPYKIHLCHQRTPDFKTHAYYNPISGEISVCIKGRQTADILRSIAHELIHHKQNQDNRLQDRENIPDIGGEIEDEANSVAGRLIKEFGYNNSKYDIYE